MTAVIALIFDIETLVEFLSIGTLLAYSIVSACVIILRYQPSKYPEDGSLDNGKIIELVDGNVKMFRWQTKGGVTRKTMVGPDGTWTFHLLWIEFHDNRIRYLWHLFEFR